MNLELSLINHEIENACVPQRAGDGYINATAMCKAVGRLFADYRRLAGTQEFLDELSASMGIHIDDLIYVQVSVRNEERGTWVHPDVAVHLAQWCSPKFAVAVSRWVREWLSGSFQTTKLPYHLERYMANRASIPITHFSMLNEMTFNLIAPLEQAGYHLPDNLLPDISEGKMFCKWLRDEKGVDTARLPTYKHVYADGRIVDAKLYPLKVLEDFRKHFFETWLPKKAIEYFRPRDEKAIPFLAKIVPYLEDTFPSDAVAKQNFEKIKGKVAAAQQHFLPKDKS